MNKKILVIEGDGIGPEVTKQSVKVLHSVGKIFDHQFDFEFKLMGACAIDETGVSLPEETLTACKESDAILFGAIGDPKYDNDPTAKVRPEEGLLQLRKSLGLYANIRPVISYPALSHLTPLKKSYTEKVDLIIYRELTGGLYFGKKDRDKDWRYA